MAQFYDLVDKSTRCKIRYYSAPLPAILLKLDISIKHYLVKYNPKSVENSRFRSWRIIIIKDRNLEWT